MSIAIVGGNECMERRYLDLCKQFNCDAKIFTKPKGLKSKIGNPDVLILFTNTVSHKMTRIALAALEENTTIIRCPSSSVSSLKDVLSNHFVNA